MNRFRMASAFLLAVILCMVPTAWSQSNEGRILGTVRDSSGAVVVAAKITVTNVDTNVVHSLVSNSSGDYLVPNLEPGLYTVPLNLEDVASGIYLVHLNNGTENKCLKFECLSTE